MNDTAHTAVAFTAPGQSELVPCSPDLKPLQAQEVAGRTLATVISAGTELAAYTGVASWAKYPFHPGYAAVFEVQDVGSGVTTFKPGDLAFCMGNHRSHQRVNAAQALPIPSGLSPEEAVFARMMSVTMSTLTTTNARPPACVLVTGLGVVGHLAARIFESCGYEVAGCDPSEARRKIARQAGLRTVLPAVPVDDPAYVDRVDLVVECSGHEQAVLDGCRVVRRRGEVVLVGVPWQKRADLSAFDLLHPVFHRYVVLRSGWEWELPLQPTDFRPGSVFGNLAGALNWLAQGRMRVDTLFQMASPKNAQQCYQDLLHNRTERLATVFHWSAA